MKHPAKFSDAIVPVLTDALLATVGAGARVLDPFAGVGGVHRLFPTFETVGIEIEPEWAGAHERTIVGNALALPFDAETFDAVVTSPTYGNRMADHHEARDGSKRMTYRHTLGRPLSAENSGAMQWGPAYRSFHETAWAEAHRVLKPRGVLVLNVSNHVRKGVEQQVVEWHAEHLVTALGMTLLDTVQVPTPRMRFGANRGARVGAEFVMVFGQ